MDIHISDTMILFLKRTSDIKLINREKEHGVQPKSGWV